MKTWAWRRNPAVERTSQLLLDIAEDLSNGAMPETKLKQLHERWKNQRAVVRAAQAKAQAFRPSRGEMLTKIISDLELNAARIQAPLARVPVTPSRLKEFRVPKRRAVKSFKTR